MGLPAPTPAVTSLLIMVIASYLIFALAGSTTFGILAYNKLILEPYQVVYSFQIWRLISYAFLHDSASPMHVIFNCLMLYMVGTPLEERWGERRFFIFVATAIILGSLLVTISYFLGISHASVVGFSAATIGLVIAWGLTFSTSQIFLFGIIPITGKQLVLMTIILEIFYAVSSNSISSAAHFGGIATGFIFCLGLYKTSKIKALWRRRR
jgi:membrane associated rhomboid family serine protease